MMSAIDVWVYYMRCLQLWNLCFDSLIIQYIDDFLASYCGTSYSVYVRMWYVVLVTVWYYCAFYCSSSVIYYICWNITWTLYICNICLRNLIWFFVAGRQHVWYSATPLIRYIFWPASPTKPSVGWLELLIALFRHMNNPAWRCSISFAGFEQTPR